MIHLVTGGSGSGKSEYAENWLTGRNKKDGTYIYIATMQPYTEETMKKIERHHRLRAGKGFRTLEKYTDLSELEIPKNQGILLECISNLVRNSLMIPPAQIKGTHGHQQCQRRIQSSGNTYHSIGSGMFQTFF